MSILSMYSFIYLMLIIPFARKVFKKEVKRNTYDDIEKVRTLSTIIGSVYALAWPLSLLWFFVLMPTGKFIPWLVRNTVTTPEERSQRRKAEPISSQTIALLEKYQLPGKELLDIAEEKPRYDINDINAPDLMFVDDTLLEHIQTRDILRDDQTVRCRHPRWGHLSIIKRSSGVTFTIHNSQDWCAVARTHSGKCRYRE